MSKKAQAFEANFDGLIGPTHHYAGHSFGNVASMSHAGEIANPREAALQGLMKARALMNLGLKQGILPPLRRPRVDILHQLGFRGTDEEMIAGAFKADPQLLAAVYSASSVWVANAATVSPSADTADGKVHFTPANLSAKFHRSIEHVQTAKNLKIIFSGDRFVHHEALPSALGDEGAANHGRLCDAHGDSGLEVFVHGRALRSDPSDPKKFPARQVLEASQSIARIHGLRDQRVVHLRQNPQAIDAGVFHNDVISVTNENVLLMHEKAFADVRATREALKRAWTGKKELTFIEVLEKEVSLTDCVKSYLFNSQLVTLPSGRMILICPTEAMETDSVLGKLQEITASGGPISEVHYFDLRQSMSNGGGPACLRLRVVLTEKEWEAVLPQARLCEDSFDLLSDLVRMRYRDRLSVADLADPEFYRETQATFDAIRDFFHPEIC